VTEAVSTLSISADVDTGTTGQTITNTASVTSVDQADPNPANNFDSAAFTVGRADLAIAKDVDNPAPDVATSVTYTVTITNNGPTAATNIVVTDLLPSGVTYSSASPSQGTYSDSTGQWNVGSLANTASATLDITAVVNTGTGGQTITNTATITAADQEDPTPDNNSDSADIAVNTYPPQVTTNAATNITPNSAILNGDLTNMGTALSVDVTFEWATEADYSLNNYNHETSPPWPMTSTGTFYFDKLPVLSSYTTYHFRAKAVGHGTAYGADLTFTTDPAQPTQPPSVNPIQGAPCVALPVDLESAPFEDPDPGDSHAASQWQVTTSAGSYASPAFDSGRDIINLTKINLTSSELDHETTYFWHVRHQDSHGLWSNWSIEAYFRTADTPVGEPTEITPDGTEIDFTQVTIDGCTYVTRSNITPPSHPEPVIPKIGLFTDITTTATYAGTIEVGLPFEPTRGGTYELTDIRLFHGEWDGTNWRWEDITTWVDTANNMVYGDAPSLSWFYIGGEWVYIGPVVPVFPNIYIGIAAAFGAAILGYFIRRRIIIQN